MGDAVSLFFGSPKWFFSNLIDPFAVGVLSLVPFVGILCLAAGVALGIRKREKSLWKFGFPFLASQVLVAVAGFLRGEVDSSQSPIVLLTFMAVILGWSLFLVYKAKGARIPALLLAVFTVSYASYASFVSWMSFSDTWM